MQPEAAKARIQQLSFMHKLPKGVSEKLLGIFQTVGKPKSIPAATVIFQFGDPHTDDAYIILHGELSVVKGDAPEVIAEAPQLIGEMGQFNPAHTRTATVIASCALETLHFKWGAWNDAVKSYLSPDELAALTKALQDYAWQHFTE